MDWFALQVRRDEDVAAELSASLVPVFRPVYSVEFWDGRKSVMVARVHALLPGYLLVGRDSLRPRDTRHWHRFMLDRVSGSPLRLPEAESFIERCEAGEFNVVKSRGPTPIEVGMRVLVEALGMAGEVLRRSKRSEFVVRLDGGRDVSSNQAGLVVV